MMEKLGGSIREVSEATGESTWKVKDKLRRGVYRASKSGRRTIVEWQSVTEAWAGLPIAKFAPPRPRRVSSTAI
jgi:hypothetical protein